MQLEIDVVIPFHKVDNLLFEAIKSCHESTGINVRLICVNDSNIAVSPKQLGMKSGDLLLTTSGREGYKAALELGVKNSSAPYLGFLDSDDLTSKERFASQVKSLQKNNLRISTCKIVKISSDGREIRDFLSFPKPPQFDSTKLSILFGAYGADSTLVCSGEFVRKTWDSHQNFPSHLADYGWLMKECLGEEIYFENSGKYYYRMHASQMSRKSNLEKDWSWIYPYWIEWLRSLSCEYPKTSKLQISSNVALILAFPSSLVRLTKSEKSELISFCKSLKHEINKGSSPEKKVWHSVINIRLLVGTRNIRYANLSMIFKIAFRSMISLRDIDSFRVNKNA